MALFAVQTVSIKMTGAASASNQRAAAKDSPRQTGPQTGDSLSSFNDLVITHQDAAYNFAVYLLGDPDLAEDVTQKAFISAFLNFHQFQGASFRAWLFKIIKNASYDEFRRPSYRKNTSLDAVEDVQERWMIADDTQDPERALENREKAAVIQRAITRVEEPYRAVLILVDVQGFDYIEAAQAAGVPLGTIKSRLARARQQFRAALQTLQAAY